MAFAPRPYQHEAIAAGHEFLTSSSTGNGMLICPTGSGKSLIIANIADKLDDDTVILQPSKEILQQNYAKYVSYGGRAGIYSASAGSKHLDKVTFATIGSIAKKHHLFRKYKNVIIDECHYCNADDGMYRDFIQSMSQAKVLGLTATPYRLTQTADGSMLRFLNRTEPRIFKDVLYYIQNNTLFDQGYLAPLKYFSFDVVDRSVLEMNAKGSDFTDASVRAYFREINMPQRLVQYARSILSERKNLVIFCSLISEAHQVAKGIPGAAVITGDTDPAYRDKVLKDFNAGKINCVVNVGVWTTGVDIPSLEAVLIGKSTMSLSWYYQVVGRIMRPYKYPDGSVKNGWVIDVGGNIKQFGKIETMKIREDDKGRYSIWNNGKQLTDVAFSKN